MGCTTLVSSEYTDGHNNVAGYIQWIASKHMALQVTDKYYAHILIRAININSTTNVWDTLVITDRTILANWSDTVVHDKNRRLTY
jgi:hemoglobin-like flavoprotein